MPRRGTATSQVAHEAFVRTLHGMLAPGGRVLIYNLAPPPAPLDKPYIPWADGRCPFAREVWEKVGFHVVAFDYGVKHNILRNLAERGCKVTVLPATAGAKEAMALKQRSLLRTLGLLVRHVGCLTSPGTGRPTLRLTPTLRRRGMVVLLVRVRGVVDEKVGGRLRGASRRRSPSRAARRLEGRGPSMGARLARPFRKT